jgi:hypothetical protein
MKMKDKWMDGWMDGWMHDDDDDGTHYLKPTP